MEETIVLEEMIGKSITQISISSDREYDYNDTLTFLDDNGDKYIFTHSQSCCESVNIEDITGNLTDLLQYPILKAEERSSTSYEGSGGCQGDSETWTFYEFATNRGSVTIRWYGTSNGYYSESVDFVVKKKNASD